MQNRDISRRLMMKSLSVIGQRQQSQAVQNARFSAHEKPDSMMSYSHLMLSAALFLQSHHSYIIYRGRIVSRQEKFKERSVLKKNMSSHDSRVKWVLWVIPPALMLQCCHSANKILTCRQKGIWAYKRPELWSSKCVINTYKHACMCGHTHTKKKKEEEAMQSPPSSLPLHIYTVTHRSAAV